ncbi:MAG: DUF1492 domain-containing protein [Clostridiales bacterium]|nr:DUF1492 domain-containing protein [Clostridiales bacterium]
MEKNDNTNYNRINRDEAIENATTFEEARAIIVSRLNALRSDLSDKSPVEDTIIAEICRAREDKKQSLMDLYAGYFAPCKVTDPAYKPKAQGDMSELMINFSEGYKAFINSLEEQYVNSIIKRRRATILLNRMLSIKMPCALIMYLYYYKHMDVEEVKDLLYMSRATFYRLKSYAINAITKLYYPSDMKKNDDDDDNGGDDDNDGTTPSFETA